MDHSKAIEHMMWYVVHRLKGNVRIRSKEHLNDIILSDMLTACEKIAHSAEAIEEIKKEI